MNKMNVLEALDKVLDRIVELQDPTMKDPREVIESFIQDNKQLLEEREYSPDEDGEWNLI